MSSARTFVGLHMPKCAGMSLLEMAQESLPSDEFYQSTAHVNNWLNGVPEFLDILNYRKLRFVWGHATHEQMLFRLHRPLLFTGLREPRARLVSHANYVARVSRAQGAGKFDAAAWISKQDNPMTWFLIQRFPTLAGHPGPGNPLDKAKRVLGAFQYVYFTETFAQGSAAIIEALGLRAEQKKVNAREGDGTDFEVDPKQLQWDIALYEWAREKFGDKPLDIQEPMTGKLWKFLQGSEDTAALEAHLLKHQAQRLHGWGKLADVLADRRTRAERLAREAAFYEQFLAGRAPAAAGK